MERREARCFASAVALVGHEGCLAPLEFAKRILTPSQFAPANWLEQPSCVHRFVRGTVALDLEPGHVGVAQPGPLPAREDARRANDALREVLARKPPFYHRAH